MTNSLSVRLLLVRMCLLVVLAGAVIALDGLSSRNDYSVTGITYDSATGAPFEIQTPVDLPRYFDLRFNALVNDANYGSLLQASGQSGSTLRLEVDPPRRLVLTLFGIDESPITLSDTFSLRRWHHIAISGMRDGRFDVAIDGAVTAFEISSIHQLQSSAEIGSKDLGFHFGRLEIGADFLHTRLLNGKIANLSLRSMYVRALPLPLAVTADALVAAAALWLLWPWLRRLRRPEVSSAELFVLVVLVASVGVGFAVNGLGVPGGQWAILLAMGAGTILGAALVGRFRLPQLPENAAALAAPCLAILVAASLLTLPNYGATVRMFERWPLASMFAVMLAVCVAAIVLDASSRHSTPSRMWRWFAWLPYVLFALLALRTDSVFAPINALHWEYVVGPIRALHQGGWLLWDVPSQYGFLDILIPAFLPIRPAVDAFYWFQAVALFAAAATFYRTLYTVLGVNVLAAGALVAAFLFLADPLLIGPTPYPSMSAVRFLWCYILLAIAVTNILGARPSMSRYIRSGTIPWIAGLLWSAESAIYVTVIFFTPLFVRLFLRRQEATSPREALSAAVKLLKLPILCALAAFGIVEACYFVALGHGPDWSMFIAYSRSYGGGYGARPIPLYGPIWTIAAILFGGAATFLALRRKGAEGRGYATAAAMALVWIISSYYVGRAYPIAVTMLSPLYVFAVFAIVRSGSVLDRISIQAAMALPLVALGLVSAFWNAESPAVAKNLLTPNVHAWTRLPEASLELESLLRNAHVTLLTPVVYYDTWIAMPRAADGPYEQNWLPTPLEDLDEPIPTAMRDEIVARFVMRHHLSGYLVQATNGSNVPETAQSWISLLSRFYTVREVAHSQDYRLLQFSLRAASGGAQ